MFVIVSLCIRIITIQIRWLDGESAFGSYIHGEFNSSTVSSVSLWKATKMEYVITYRLDSHGSADRLFYCYKL